LLVSHGDWSIFFTRPICIILLVLALVSIHAGLRISRIEKKLQT